MVVSDHITLRLWLAEDWRVWSGGGPWGEWSRGAKLMPKLEASDSTVGVRGTRWHILILFLPFCPFPTAFSSKRNFFTGSLTRKLYYT